MTYLSTHPGYRELPVEEGLDLIQPDLAHAAESLLWVRSPEVVQYMGAEFPEPSHEGELERIKEVLGNDDEYSWMIEFDSNVIGNVCLNSIKETSKKLGARAGNLTILIGDKDHWGKGIATKVCLVVIDWAFSDGRFEAMGARALKENIGSIKTLEKLGFQEIGTEPYEGVVHGKKSEWRCFRLDPPTS